jgi:hypothetical protein
MASTELQRLFDVVAAMKENAEPVSISALEEKGIGKEILFRWRDCDQVQFKNSRS